MIKIDVYSGVFPFALASGVSELKSEFVKYIESNHSPFFGRDFPYERPTGIEEYGIRHVHILSKKEYDKFQQQKRPQYQRTSDNHLIYAINPEDPNHYLLICILSPEAHKQANELSRMRNLMNICRRHFKIR